jgi:hypothetical protein
MASVLSRRQALTGLGVAAIGSAASPAVAAAAPPSVRGAWLIQPKTTGGPTPFRVLAALRPVGCSLPPARMSLGWASASGIPLALTGSDSPTSTSISTRRARSRVRGCREEQRSARLRRTGAGSRRPTVHLHWQAGSGGGAMSRAPVRPASEPFGGRLRKPGRGSARTQQEVHR